MFYSLKGILSQKFENFLVLDIGGVGFKVFTSEGTLSGAAQGTEITVYTYTHVREDALDIFGFLSKEELSFFQKLISISGVGPKVALAILSTHSPQGIVFAVLSSDAKKLSRAPGVGIKLAQRIILELKDKMKNEEVTEAIETPVAASRGNEEAIGALLALGYSEGEARRAIASVGDGLSLEETIKKALIALAG